jgi:uncharacterized repeat protein (TIGR04076 family)
MTESDCIRKEPWQILGRVIIQEGECPFHKVGDEVIFTGSEVKGTICMSALYSMIAKVYAMTYNAYFPWVEDQCVATHACPDHLNPVVFELTRIPRDNE